MKVDLSLDSMDECDSESGVPLWSISKLETVIEEFFEEIWPGSQNFKSIEISVRFLSEDIMRDYNKMYREVDKSTDVLSFPMWECNYQFEPPEGWESLPLGDILICPSVVFRNTTNLNLDYPSEMILMLAHGILHLIGMDHDIPERKKKMWDLQAQLTQRIFACLQSDEGSSEGRILNG